ncbi:hypothetical protein; putative membrane protein [Alloactinosynnema sp. L-07]|uniref:lysylphosphatidylglycerol synthase domain-containing protein n=1 Tax=Alloactinosynnema sp. L-07 TaxID=1653480 RepID=UPI00065EFE26|nr:lysylphosphatidylglycerol synthase domain-containing protein [Alloactinosynnema sp. L-07]CRK60890.1 hypothetical protein; putative membrane protein [Alloactinosynnema sp. L-07]
MTVDVDVTQETEAKKGSSLKSIAVAWARRLLLVVVVAGAVWTLSRNWNTVWDTLKTLPWGSVLLSELSVMVGIGIGVMAWRTLVEDLGPHVGVFRCAQINLVGSLGKYVPGSVWAYLLQMELARKAKVGRARIFTASLVQVGLALVAAALFGVLAMPVLIDKFPGAIFFAVLLPVGLLALHPRLLNWATNKVLKLIKRSPLERPLHFRMVGEALGFQIVSYFFYGLHLWVLVDAVGAASGLTGLLLCTGAIAIGLNAGMFVFVLPSGAGVRDGVIVAVLLSALPYGQALAFAVVSRVMFLIADLTTAGVAALLARWRVPLPAATA